MIGSNNDSLDPQPGQCANPLAELFEHLVDVSSGFLFVVAPLSSEIDLLGGHEQKVRRLDLRSALRLGLHQFVEL